MPYVTRNKSKKIVVVSALPQYEGQEMLRENSKEIKAFRKPFANKIKRKIKTTKKPVKGH